MTSPTPPERPANTKLRSLTVAVLAAVAIAGGLVARAPAPSTPPPPADSSVVTQPPRDTTPAPTPAPSPAPSTSWSGLSGLQLVGDDYTTYASAADFLKTVSSAIGGTGNVWTALYHDGRRADTQVTLDPTAYHGHPALRYTFPVGGGPPELWPQLPRALDVAWFRSKIRFAPGFTTIGTTPNDANAYKLLGMAWAPGQGNGRLDFAITNTTEYQLAFEVLVNGSAVAATPWVVGGHVTTEWTDGQWYDVILEYNRTSPTTAIARAWMALDGSAPVLRATASTARTDGGTLPQIGAVMLGLNFNQNIVNAMAMDRGPWEVVDGAQHPDPYRVHGGVN